MCAFYLRPQQAQKRRFEECQVTSLLLFQAPPLFTLAMFFRFESALMNPATIVLSTRLGFPRKCLKSSLFYHYLYWIDQKSIIRSLVIFSESLLTVVVAPCELTVSDEAKKKDKDYRSTLVKAKVRAIISCEECKKPRCIYANSRLSSCVSSVWRKPRHTFVGVYYFQMDLLLDVLFWSEKPFCVDRQ